MHFSSPKFLPPAADECPAPTADLRQARDPARDRAASAVRHLSQFEKLVLVLHYHEGLSTEEIAAVLGLPTEVISAVRLATCQRLRRPA